MNILEVKNITKILAKKNILNWINFSVKAWEIYWFLWPNGSWKTTTMKCIMWLISPDSWEINIFWKKWLTLQSKKDIWFMPENTYLYKYLTWKEFLEFNGKFFGLSWKKLDLKVKTILKQVWLQDSSNKFLNQYSKWMLQRIWLAQSIINDPKILFLDEPMSWLDPIWRKMIKDLLICLKNKWTTIFFNTHILADVESICDRISIINMWNMLIEWKKVSSIKWSLEDFFIKQILWK